MGVGSNDEEFCLPESIRRVGQIPPQGADSFQIGSQHVDHDAAPKPAGYKDISDTRSAPSADDTHVGFDRGCGFPRYG